MIQATQVLIDASPLCENRPTGIGVYALELIKNLKAPSSKIELQIGLPMTKIKYLKRVQAQVNQKVHIISPLDYLKSEKYQIIHGLDYKLPSFTFAHKVLTIHDMGAFEEDLLDPNFAQVARQKLYHNLIEKNPDHIICVSEFTKKRFLHFFPQFESHTTVIHLGCDHIKDLWQGTKNEITSVPDTIELSSFLKELPPYILYVGNIEKRKNLDLLLKSFEILKDRNSDLNLVVVGKPGYMGLEILHTLFHHKYKKSIHYMGYINNKTLQKLYSQARVFAYPSIYEGFGIPVIEAMKWNLPVVGVDGSAIHEVAHGAALLVNDQDPELFSIALRKAHQDEQIRQAMISLGHAKAKLFTWDACAQKTSQVYSRVMFETEPVKSKIKSSLPLFIE